MFYIFLIFFSSFTIGDCYNYEVVIKPLETRDIKKEVAEINSMKQVKDTLKQLMTELDECGTGSCNNIKSMGICDYIALVDIRLDGALGIGMTSDEPHGFKTTREDIDLLKRIGNSCKVSSYQHWNFPHLTHVRYLPSPKDNKWINHRLGLITKQPKK